MSDKVPMTVQGAEKLRQELHQLKTVERPEVVKAIATARAHGDLKENAEYHAAREKQSFIEGRILEIESKLSHANIIDTKKMENTGRVIFGATVKLFDLNTENSLTYMIVGEDEANVNENKISLTSPIARAMIGKEKGDCIVVRAPQGEMEYEIIEVEY
ncbi:MAG: transcription elongation factor GreA [Gammaproteobacteria bacterium]